ncbi:MAG TPA: MFS transporter [Ktedonobacterales bacterium]|jgi:MFS family permease
MLQAEPAPEQKEQRRNPPPKGLAVLGVLRHSAMLRLWLAQVIYLSVQSAASYGMIVRMTDETGSATLVGLVLIALTLPPFLLGAPAGALVDRMDRRNVLWVSNALRALATALFVLALLATPHAFYSIYLLALLFSLVGLFFTPAEGALIPTLVNEEELLPALSLYNLTLNVSQAVGLLVLGPLMLSLLPTIIIPLGGQHQLTLLPIETLFVLITLLYLLAAVLIHSLPRGRRPAPRSAEVLASRVADEDRLHDPPLSGQALASNVEPTIPNWQQLRTDLRDGWQLVRKDGILSDSLLQACFGSLMMMTIAGLATIFVERFLNLPSKDTALIFTPAGIGIVVGSLLIPVVVSHLGQMRTIIVGMIGMAVGIGLLPVAQHIAQLAAPDDWWTEPTFLLIVAALTTLVGFSLDFIIVPAQAEMQERSPDEMRGRVLALYQALFNGGSIPVLLFMGAVADLLGIVVVLYLMAGLSLTVALLATLRALFRNRERSHRGSLPVAVHSKRPHQLPQPWIDEHASADEMPEGAPL